MLMLLIKILPIASGDEFVPVHQTINGDGVAFSQSQEAASARTGSRKRLTNATSQSRAESCLAQDWHGSKLLRCKTLQNTIIYYNIYYNHIVFKKEDIYNRTLVNLQPGDLLRRVLLSGRISRCCPNHSKSLQMATRRTEDTKGH